MSSILQKNTELFSNEPEGLLRSGTHILVRVAVFTVGRGVEELGS